MHVAYLNGYLNAGQPMPSIGLGVYVSTALGSLAAGAGWVPAAFPLLFAVAGFLADLPAAGFLGALFFFAGGAMPRNLPHAPGPVNGVESGLRPPALSCPGG